MKRERALLENEVLDIKSIINAIGSVPICHNLTNNRLNQKDLKFKFNVFPDPTMEKTDQADEVDEDSVLIRPSQYELLINTHSKVLAARLKYEEFGFRLNTGPWVSYGCSHCNLTVNEAGYAEWEVSFHNL